jgi:hypothetical protein
MSFQKKSSTVDKIVFQKHEVKELLIFFDIELANDEVALIDGLDKNHRFGYDPMMV